jgi:hypothetical protein
MYFVVVCPEGGKRQCNPKIMGTCTLYFGFTKPSSINESNLH